MISLFEVVQRGSQNLSASPGLGRYTLQEQSPRGDSDRRKGAQQADLGWGNLEERRPFPRSNIPGHGTPAARYLLDGPWPAIGRGRAWPREFGRRQTNWTPRHPQAPHPSMPCPSCPKPQDAPQGRQTPHTLFSRLTPMLLFATGVPFLEQIVILSLILHNLPRPNWAMPEGHERCPPKAFVAGRLHSNGVHQSYHDPVGPNSSDGRVKTVLPLMPLQTAHDTRPGTRCCTRSGWEGGGYSAPARNTDQTGTCRCDVHFSSSDPGRLFCLIKGRMVMSR